MEEIKATNYEEKLNSEIEKRLNIIESPSYNFLAPLNKCDYFLVVIVVLICLAFLIMGAFL